MADGITVEFKDAEVQKLLNKLIKRIDKPGKLLKQIEKYVHAVTRLMLTSGKPRPDTKAVRGVKWAKLKPATIAQKAALKKSGKAIEIHRPLVRTGKMRAGLKVQKRSQQGFTYGTKVRSKSGFPYPGAHQAGGRNLPQRKFVFLTRKDLRQMIYMAVNYLKGREVNFNKYLK